MTTDSFHKWHLELFDKMGGIPAKQMSIFTSGRQVGKSMLNSYYELSNLKYREITSAQVDGEMWYTIQCVPEVSNWIRTHEEHEGTQWDQLIDNNWNVFFNKFDVHEEFYMLLKLRWGC
jgi:hypothetical protein